MKFRVRVFGELRDDKVQDGLEDAPLGMGHDCALLGPAEGTWQVEFAMEAPDEQRALDVAGEIAEGLKFGLGQHLGVDLKEFS